jgi:hypothetical protein
LDGDARHTSRYSFRTHARREQKNANYPSMPAIAVAEDHASVAPPLFAGKHTGNADADEEVDGKSWEAWFPLVMRKPNHRYQYPAFEAGITQP